MILRPFALLLVCVFAVSAGADESASGDLQPVTMTGLAKSAFFLLRSLADNESPEAPVGARVLVDEQGFETFRKELEAKYGVAFQRQTYERPETLLSTRPYQYEDDGGVLRSVRLRALPESGEKGAKRLIEFRADDALADQAVGKFHLRLPEEAALALFKREEFLARKKEFQRLAEKDSVNEGVPAREMLNLIELLHLSSRKGPALALVNVSYRRTRYQLEVPLAGVGKKKATIEISVDQSIRLSGAKGELIHDTGKTGRLIEVRLPTELVRLGVAELAKAPGLAKLKDGLAKLEARRASDASFRAFFETKRDGPVARTAISPEN